MRNPHHQFQARALLLGAMFSLAASAFFFWLLYVRYLNVEFNELGRFFNAEEQVVQTDSAFVWCLPAFGFLVLAAALMALRKRRRRTGPSVCK